MQSIRVSDVGLKDEVDGGLKTGMGAVQPKLTCNRALSYHNMWSPRHETGHKTHTEHRYSHQQLKEAICCLLTWVLVVGLPGVWTKKR